MSDWCPERLDSDTTIACRSSYGIFSTRSIERLLPPNAISGNAKPSTPQSSVVRRVFEPRLVVLMRDSTRSKVLEPDVRNGWKANINAEGPAGLTLLIPPPYSDGVIRLFIIVLCALGLAFSPAATSGAVAAPTGMPGCTMGHMPAKPADHSKMDCCTAACQMTAPALLPELIADAAPLKTNGALRDRAAVKDLASFTASGLDPPPRLPS